MAKAGKKKVNLLETTDPVVWAKEFIRYKKKNKWKLEDIDEALMVGWFANAMAAQEFEDAEIIERLQDAAQKLLEPMVCDSCKAEVTDIWSDGVCLLCEPPDYYHELLRRIKK
jgi:hypothetical protein